MDAWIKKKRRCGMCVRVCACVCLCVCVSYSAMKKNQIFLFVTTWMDLKASILSEISQIKKDKYHTFLIRDAVFDKKTKQMNKTKQNHRY